MPFKSEALTATFQATHVLDTSMTWTTGVATVDYFAAMVSAEPAVLLLIYIAVFNHTYKWSSEVLMLTAKVGASDFALVAVFNSTFICD